MDVRVSVENYKSEVMTEEYRQDLLYRTSAEVLGYDESKKPAGEPVNESFRKLTVDWTALIVNRVIIRSLLVRRTMLLLRTAEFFGK